MPSVPKQRNCPKCGKAKTFGGNRWRCRPCDNAYAKARGSAYYEANRERMRAANRANYASHKAEYIARAKAWKAANPERRRELAAAYYERNRESLLRRQMERYAADKTRFAAAEKKWRLKNPEARIAANHRRRARVMDSVCEHGVGCADTEFFTAIYDQPCLYCGAPAEHADHFMPLANGGLHCRENLAPACAPCNISKGASDPLEWMSSRS